jgi:hypothetical protein
VPASGVRTHTTARLAFDRETYTPCTSEALPSLAVNDAMIAERSDFLAGRADEPVANAAVVGVTASAITAGTTKESERNVTSMDPNGSGRA